VACPKGAPGIEFIAIFLLRDNVRAAHVVHAPPGARAPVVVDVQRRGVADMQPRHALHNGTSDRPAVAMDAEKRRGSAFAERGRGRQIGRAGAVVVDVRERRRLALLADDPQRFGRAVGPMLDNFHVFLVFDVSRLARLRSPDQNHFQRSRL
jgi:hypothetical protein